MNLNHILFESQRLLNQLGVSALTPEMDASGQTPRGVLTVYWNQNTGGQLNPSTGATVGGQETLWSGTLPAVAVEEGARTVLRQFSEIAVGDLLVTLPGTPVVTLFPGQMDSGTLPLEALADWQPWFEWQGRRYAQKNMSAELRGLWSEAVSGQVIAQGLLLRRAT